MQNDSHGRFIRTDIWREGDYFDLWSVSHFLSGIAVALAIYFFHFGIVASCIIAFLIFVAYEMWEAMVQIEETRMNRVLDVVVGMLSFTPTFLLAPLFSMTQLIATCVVVTCADSVLSYFGWLESQKAEVLEQKFRIEFEQQKIKMRARRESMKKRLQTQRHRFKMMKRTWKYQHFFRPHDSNAL